MVFPGALGGRQLVICAHHGSDLSGHFGISWALLWGLVLFFGGWQTFLALSPAFLSPSPSTPRLLRVPLSPGLSLLGVFLVPLVGLILKRGSTLGGGLGTLRLAQLQDTVSENQLTPRQGEGGLAAGRSPAPHCAGRTSVPLLLTSQKGPSLVWLPSGAGPRGAGLQAGSRRTPSARQEWGEEAWRAGRTP